LDRANKGAYTQSLAYQAWEKVAGESVLHHTTGAHVREGELIVLVDSPLWATELSSLSEQFKKAVNEEAGQNLVRAVRFTVSRRVEQVRRVKAAEQAAEDSYSEDKVDPVPLSESELAQVVESVRAIDDLELREAVMRATVADFQWKKGLKHRESR